MFFLSIQSLQNLSKIKNTDLPVKNMIAQKAASFIPDQSVLYLDTGSTVTCLARLLKETRSGLTIITNSLSVTNALVGSDHSVMVAGGQLNSNNLSLEGYQSSAFLSTVKFEYAFFGSNGFERHKGPTSCEFLDVQSKQAALNNARTNIVLAEGSK